MLCYLQNSVYSMLWSKYIVEVLGKSKIKKKTEKKEEKNNGYN